MKNTESQVTREVLDLHSSFGYVFKKAHQVFTAALSTRLQPLGITLSQWYFLRVLWQEDGLTQRELSRRMEVSEPTTKAALQLLARAGLVSITRHATHRNAVHVFLTRKGRSLEAEVVHIAGDVNGVATRGIDEQRIEDCKATIHLMLDNLMAEANER